MRLHQRRERTRLEQGRQARGACGHVRPAAEGASRCADDGQGRVPRRRDQLLVGPLRAGRYTAGGPGRAEEGRHGCPRSAGCDDGVRSADHHAGPDRVRRRGKMLDMRPDGALAGSGVRDGRHAQLTVSCGARKSATAVRVCTTTLQAVRGRPAPVASSGRALPISQWKLMAAASAGRNERTMSKIWGFILEALRTAGAAHCVWSEWDRGVHPKTNWTGLEAAVSKSRPSPASGGLERGTYGGGRASRRDHLRTR